ncbi:MULTISPECIES: hypothetical protein [unclassified Bradyrhizobium]|uniref:hypothetical protein n=1 Tax=Bradyrhizobium sp. USDA 4541 TaxID=2817704 RepID=UPI0020A50170|nr:hypothetical protein [Bradyrhizobium sp. USDA 4541]MCP1848919.1 hypothetical protein [Bradyrhizobium sp. USDA 4541]
MVGEIISEWWATSNRNGGRDHSGMVGDIERNQHQGACCHAEADAGWDLARTIPTTLGGVAAVLEYVKQYEDKGEEWPNSDCIGREGWHYQLRQIMATAAVNLA